MRILLIEGDPVATEKVEGALAHANLKVVKARLESGSTDRGNLRGFDAVLDVGFEEPYEKCPDHDTREVRSGKTFLNSSRAESVQSEQHVSEDDHSAMELEGSRRLDKDSDHLEPRQTTSENKISIGNLTVHMESEVVKVAGTKVRLSESEYQILELLCRNIGQIVTIKDFVQHMYGNAKRKPKPKIVSVFVCRLRSKLENASGGESYIGTVWGKGYILTDPNSAR